MRPSKYSIEIWSGGNGANNVLLADFAGLAKNRHITLSRNEAEDIEWQMDLNDLEAYARSIKTTASLLIQPGITEVRVKRGSTYICGGKVVWRNPTINSTTQSMDIRATGFLNLFADRYTAALRTYTNVERTTIASTLITESQGQGANWDFGVTIGTLVTLGVYSRQYQNVRIKDALQDLTKLQVAFDFEFTPDKVFNTYAAIGTKRPEIIFEYPGNIKTLQSPLDATGIANRLYLLGSGIGQSAAVQITSEDTNSEANYKVREKPILLSDILDSGTLSDYGLAQLAAWGTPFEIPVIEYDGSRAPYVTDYRIGDYVTLRCSGYDSISQINGLYRVEKVDLTIDDNDTETVKVSFGR